MCPAPPGAPNARTPEPVNIHRFRGFRVGLLGAVACMAACGAIRELRQNSEFLAQLQGGGEHLGVGFPLEGGNGNRGHPLDGDGLRVGVLQQPSAGLAVTDAGILPAAHRGVEGGEGRGETVVDVD